MKLPNELYQVVEIPTSISLLPLKKDKFKLISMIQMNLLVKWRKGYM